MKATEQYFPVVLFMTLYKVVLTLSLASYLAVFPVCIILLPQPGLVPFFLPAPSFSSFRRSGVSLPVYKNGKNKS